MRKLRYSLQMHHNCMFIAFGEFRTFKAITPDFLRKLALINLFKPKFMKKIELVGESENLFYSEFSRLRHAFFNQSFAKTPPPVLLSYCKRPNLRKIFP